MLFSALIALLGLAGTLALPGAAEQNDPDEAGGQSRASRGKTVSVPSKTTPARQ
jgi:hypothetical protein